MNQTMTIENLLNQFIYSPSEPLIFTSGLFIFFFLFFSLGYSALYNKLNSRILYVIAFSLFFYYKTSGLYFLILIALSLYDYGIGYFIYTANKISHKKWLVAASVTANLSILFYFKYTSLIANTFNELFNGTLNFGEIFLPIGVSFFTFQSMSYTIDLYRGNIKPLQKWIDHLFYLSFFPQLVAGPIVRAKDFIPQITRNPIILSRYEFGRGIFLVSLGLLKKGVISDYISLNFVDRIFDAPLLYTGFENLIGVYSYSLQIYCDFSGYSDMAIGIALLLGFHFNDNFRFPYKSATITEFWRRWHISLSFWLRDYLYISLGGNRKSKIRTYINLFITMLLGGLWHGASWNFVIWGGIHGILLALHKFIMELFPTLKATGDKMKKGQRALSVFFTFNLVSFCWIFFRADSLESALNIISQIFTSFDGSILFDFIVGYKKCLIFIASGFIYHFLSDRWHKAIEFRFIKLSFWYYPLILTLIVWLIMQIRSGELQPFIYFQF